MQNLWLLMVLKRISHGWYFITILSNLHYMVKGQDCHVTFRRIFRQISWESAIEFHYFFNALYEDSQELQSYNSLIKFNKPFWIARNFRVTSVLRCLSRYRNCEVTLEVVAHFFEYLLLWRSHCYTYLKIFELMDQREDPHKLLATKMLLLLFSRPK